MQPLRPEGWGNQHARGGFRVEKGPALGVGLPEVSGSWGDAGQLADTSEALVQVPLPLSPLFLVWGLGTSFPSPVKHGYRSPCVVPSLGAGIGGYLQRMIDTFRRAGGFRFLLLLDELLESSQVEGRAVARLRLSVGVAGGVVISQK